MGDFSVHVGHQHPDQGLRALRLCSESRRSFTPAALSIQSSESRRGVPGRLLTPCPSPRGPLCSEGAAAHQGGGSSPRIKRRCPLGASGSVPRPTRSLPEARAASHVQLPRAPPAWTQLRRAATPASRQTDRPRSHPERSGAAVFPYGSLARRRRRHLNTRAVSPL